MKNISKLLLKKGNSYYRKGRILIKIFLISLAVFVLIQLVNIIGWGASNIVLTLTATSIYGFVNILIIVAYLGILVGLIGVPFYFIGLHYLGLGQISKNTDNLSRQEIPKDELPEL